jgi:hypothetical protein
MGADEESIIVIATNPGVVNRSTHRNPDHH